VSASREGFLLIVVVNVVLSICVVGAAFALFGPTPETASPTGSSLTQEVEAVRQEMETLRDGLERALEENAKLQSELGDMTARIASLEQAPRALSGAGALAAGEPGAAAARPEPSPEERMMKGIAEMMKSRIKRERDRFINDVMNPTERSRERQKRGIERSLRFIKDRLDLTETELVDVTQVLTEVDNNRREQLKTLMEAKESTDDVEYPEVKKILDDSFVTEDRIIEQALPAEKATEYKESAGAFRQMIYGAAKMAFPEKEEEE